MSTNDTIIGEVRGGSFRFPIQFEMFGEKQSIEGAVYDTGCSHSLISASSLFLGNKSEHDLRRQAVYGENIILSIGKGVEGREAEVQCLREVIRKINHVKKKAQAGIVCHADVSRIIDELVAEDEMRLLDNSPNIRFEYLAVNYTIDGVLIGDFHVKVAFNIENVNLIGMHIIKELYTKIYAINNKVYLFAQKNSASADSNLNDVMLCFLKKTVMINE